MSQQATASAAISEDTVEQAALELFVELGYSVASGTSIGAGELFSERSSYSEVVLPDRLREGIARLNPGLPDSAREEAVRKVLNLPSLTVERTNRVFHQMLRDPVTVEYPAEDGSVAWGLVKLADFEDVEANDWLAVNQFTVVEGHHNRRPDIVIFLNGMPVGIVELKNPTDEDATIWSAFQQLQTYKSEIPNILQYNEALVVSDGLQARIGSLTANQEWFKVWRTIDDAGGRDSDSSKTVLELFVLIRGVFAKRRFLDLIRHFVVFEEDTDTDRLHKILAGYHQFHAVNTAVEQTMRASAAEGDRRVGVVWHTQGSGKSLSMLFYAGRIIREPAMENPTIVVLTDRNDLDDQLFGQLQRCHELLGQTPVQAEDRETLKSLLRVSSGGVVFTTIQKFLPEKGGKTPALSERRNIVVIADEAHRSQYDFIDGFARHMRDALPNASFIGFTGTPIEKADANTRAVFGDYISVYDIQQAVVDRATVPIYYESRIARLRLNAQQLGTLDEEFDEITEGEEEDRKRKLQTKWAALESLVGDPKRIELIAADLVEHYEKRLEALNGKAMVVCMSRRICVDLYNAIVRIRPDWVSAKDDDDAARAGCVAKVVMTGSAADGPEWQPHIRSKQKRRELANRFKDAKDPFRIVIVRDMWLTGFDAPCLHTMYADKPMHGHGLMQAIARVNRVFRDKPGGLVVDYLGLADQLKQALAAYTESGGRGDPTFDEKRAIEALLEKHEVACGMMHGFDWSDWAAATGMKKLALLPGAQEHVLQQRDGKKRFVQVVTDLSRAFALCAASDEAAAIRDDVAFFQAVQAALAKRSAASGRSPEEIDAAVRQLVAKAIVANEGVIDVFTAAGLKKPDISILDERFLAEVRGLKHKNVAAELLEKLLKDEIRLRSNRNVVMSQLFSEQLKKALNAYHNRAIATQEVIEELIRLAKDLDAAARRGENLGLTQEEVAFYDALATNDSARQVMGDEKLKVIAGELIRQVRKSVTIDWQYRESARARIRVMVKRILNKYGYPPDLQEEAVKLVLRQTELLCVDWV